MLKIPLSGHLEIPLSDQVENSTHWPPENSSQIPFISLNLSYAGSWHLKIWFSKQQYRKNHFLLHFWQLWRVSEIIFIVHFQMSRLVATADFRNYANSTIPKTLEGQNWEPETYPVRVAECIKVWSRRTNRVQTNFPWNERVSLFYASKQTCQSLSFNIVGGTLTLADTWA